jgi:hypothetical protein
MSPFLAGLTTAIDSAIASVPNQACVQTGARMNSDSNSLGPSLACAASSDMLPALRTTWAQVPCTPRTSPR